LGEHVAVRVGSQDVEPGPSGTAGARGAAAQPGRGQPDQVDHV